MKQKLLEQELRDLRAYLQRLEDEIIQGSRETALMVIRARKRELAAKKEGV